jgi:hypothetical protein
MSKKRIFLADILAQAGDVFGVTSSDIIGHNRQRDVSLARQACFYLAHERTNLSSKEIGRRMKRDHSTILHGVVTASERMKRDHLYRGRIKQLEAKVANSRHGDERPVNLDVVAAESARIFGLRPHHIAMRTWRPHLATARSICFYTAYSLTSLTKRQIATEMGFSLGRVEDGIADVTARLRRDAGFKAIVRQVRRRVKAAKPIVAEVAPAPAPIQKITVNDGPDWWELSDDDFISRRIAEHKARGGDFVEVWA